VLYRVSKAVRRRKAAFAGAAFIACSLMVGLVLALWGLREADRARRQAQTQADRLGAVNSFLRDMLSSAGPEPMEGHETTVREVVDVGAAALDGGSLRDQPEVEATARLTIGRTYAYLGKLDTAERHLRRAADLRERSVGRVDPIYAEALGALADVERQRGNRIRAVEMYREAIDLFAMTSPGHADLPGLSLSLASALYTPPHVDEAVGAFATAIEMADRIAGPDSFDALNARFVSAAMQHRPQDSIATARQAIATLIRTYGPLHPHVSATHLELGTLLHMMRDFDGAGEAYGESLRLRMETLGPDHPLTHVSRMHLAWLDESRGNFAAAGEAFLALANDDVRVFGPRVGNIPTMLNRAAVAFQKAGDLPRAQAALRQALACFAPPDPRPASVMLALVCCNLADHTLNQRNLDETRQLVQRVLDIEENILPAGDWIRGRAAGLLGAVLIGEGSFPEAEALLLRANQIMEGDSSLPRAGFRTEIRRRLVALYTRWEAAQPGVGHAQSAEQWRAAQDGAGS
jgi:tetratricopeptide (TPR) repeat protein